MASIMNFDCIKATVRKLFVLTKNSCQKHTKAVGKKFNIELCFESLSPPHDLGELGLNRLAK